MIPHSGRKKKPLSHKDLDTIARSLKGFAQERPEICLVYVFGSLVKRTSGSSHDIDIAVYVDPSALGKLDRESPYGYRALLSSQLGRLLRCGPVDLALLNDSSPLLSRQIIGTGNLVFCRSEHHRIRFEVRELQRYADTAPIRRIKRFYMNRRIEKGLAAYA